MADATARKSAPWQRRLPTAQLLFGAAVVLLGVLLLLDTTGVYPTGDLRVYVPSLFVLVGLWALVRSGLHNVVGPLLVVVPRDWNVEMDVLPVLAAASDDRPRRERRHDEVDLVVTGFAAFGGVSVTD